VLQQRHREIAVVWLDAHGDFNTPAITVSGYLGGMPLAMLAGRAPELFAGPLGLRPVPEHNIVLADARDLDPAERDALAASQVRHIPATPGAFAAALPGLGDLPVYLHVDVDIMDSTEIPGLRFPSGPGPTLAEVEACLTTITTSADVVAACLACAWLPGPVSKPPAREAITRLAGGHAGRRSDQHAAHKRHPPAAARPASTRPPVCDVRCSWYASGCTERGAKWVLPAGARVSPGA
jgi:arginase